MRRHFSQIIKGPRLRKETLAGASRLAKAVSLTLGPGGRTVVVDPFEAANYSGLSVKPQPIITKDGVTVAKYLSRVTRETGCLKNIGSKLLADAADRANEESGDGTTTCTVIA